MDVTLGGDRLGSGNKNKIALRNYERSTHNLSQNFTSSMQCGILYPFLCLPAMRGDKFIIDLNADCRTIPTKAPLFGSFKMQIDLFQCDIRLYQAILHNNPLKIGMKMGQVKFPVLHINDDTDCKPFANNSLLKYLGMSGLGHYVQPQGKPSRRINAIPALAYYEIFKTYYSNKQEENAYLIADQIVKGDVNLFQITANDETYQLGDEITYNQEGLDILIEFGNNPSNTKKWQDILRIRFGHYNSLTEQTTYYGSLPFSYLIEHKLITELTYERFRLEGAPTGIMLLADEENINRITFVTTTTNTEYESIERGLKSFKLSQIDDMRLALLSKHTLGYPFVIGTGQNDDWTTNSGENEDGLPYRMLVDVKNVDINDYNSLNQNPMNGLVVKTYQSDMFNNWINTEWIDGENGIAAITAISTSSGSIKIDSLNLSEKLYNMMNRVAVSDGSYDGWQDAVYTETPKRHIESPIYLGGMSSEIVFQEITSTAETAGQPLGTLAGKGRILKRKGGHVVVKCNEAAFIIGIVSLTPRINYSQGNEFYMTDLLSMDDLHKPALDGIGFQNLIAERLAYWDTALAGGGSVVNRHTIGKIPAWMEYMTAVDKVYGDFADETGGAIMSLIRRYDKGENSTIADATTYIDPSKYNYAFAVADIDAQNFWVEIHSNITARRLMSAKQIPNI